MRSKEEHNIQVQIVNYLRLRNIFVFAVANGGSRNLFEAKNLKLEGLKAGVSDLIIVLKNEVIFVEIKTLKGKQQDTQKEFENKVKELGHQYLIWRSLDDCIEFIENLNKK